MSQTIDSRVVEMKFDNKNFEKNVAESMKTLDQLSKRVDKLEDTQVDFGKIQKAADSFDLSKMDKALDSITHRFSIMGQVGASVISNITTDAYNMVKSFGSKVWGTVFGQMKSGGQARAHNVENAKFLLEGMGITYSKEVEDQISDAVADTAFGFDEAAMAMAQLSGASVQLGDNMDKALKGISGVAAMTNRSFSDIADIFVDAAATGKVSADTFNRLSERGLAAKGIMQEFYGVTAEELDKLAKKGAISFNDFSKAMYDAFGTQAKKSNETLEGVMANTRAVLSRMGQSFYQPLMANNSDVVKFFQQLKDTLKGFEGPVKEIGKQLSGYVLNLARFGTEFLKKIDVAKFQPVLDNLSKTFENLYFAAQNFYSNILKPFGKIFKDALYEAFPSLNTGKSLLETISIKIKDASERFRQFTAEIGLFGDKGASVKEVLVSIFNALKVGITILKSITKIAKTAVVVVANFLKTINFGGFLKGLTQDIAQFAQIGFYLIAGIAEGLLNGTPVIFSTIAEVVKMIISAFCAFFGISSPSKIMRDKVGYWLVAGIAEGMKKALAAGLITGAIALVFVALLNQFREGEEKLSTTASRLIDGIINKIAGAFDRFSKWLGGTGLGKAVSAGFGLITTTLTKLSDGIKSFDVTKFTEIIGAIKQMVVLGAFVYILIQFSLATTMFTSAMYNLSRAAKFYMNAMQIKYFGATLKNLAIAIGVITASIMMFAGMIKAGDGKVLVQGLITIGIVVAGLVLAIKQIQGAVKAEKLGPHGLIKVEAMFVGMAAAILMIASAIKKVGRLDLPQLIAGLVGIGGLVVVLSLFMVKLQKLSDKGGFQLEQSWLMLVGIGVAVRLIAGAIKTIAKLDPEQAKRATIYIGVITGIVGAISILTQVFSKLKSGQLVDNITNLNLPAMFLAIGVAVNLIAIAIKTLSNIDPGKIEQGKSIMYQIMAWMAVMVGLSIFSSKIIGTILLGFAAAVAGIAVAIKLIGEMQTGVVQGFAALLVIMGLLAGFVGAVNAINKATGGGGLNNNGIKAILFAGLAIAAMGYVVSITGTMTVGQIAKGLFVVAALSTFVAALGILFGLNDKGGGLGSKVGTKTSFFELMKGKANNMGNAIKTIWMIKAVVGALVKLILAVVVMSKVVKDYNQLSLAITSLAGIMGVLSLLLITIGVVTKEFPNVDKITKPLVALTGAILVIAGSLLVLSSMPNPGNLIPGLFAIAGILLAMGYVLEKSKVFGVQGMNIKGILACTVAIMAIAASITLLISAIGDGDTLQDYIPVIAAVAGIVIVLRTIASALKKASGTSIDLKSVGAFVLATSSLLVAAVAIAGLAYYTDDIVKAGLCAAYLAGTILSIAGALKLAGNVKWTAVAGLLAGALAMVGVAAALNMVAQYDWQNILASFLALNATLWSMVGALAVLSMLADTGIGAAGLVIAAGAMAVMAVALIGIAEAMDIATTALTRFIAIFTPETANNILGFFTTIGDGMGPAATSIINGIKAIIDAVKSSAPDIEASLNELITIIGDAMVRLAQTIEAKGIEVANALGHAVTAIKAAAESAGFDIVSGLATGISKNKGLSIAAAVALGAMTIAGLRSKDGIDAHSDSVKTVAAGYDFDHGLGTGITKYANEAVGPAKSLGATIINTLGNALTGANGIDFSHLLGGLKNIGGNLALDKLLGSFTGGSATTDFLGSVKEFGIDTGTEFMTGAGEGVAQGGGLLSGLISSFTSGNFDNLLGGFDFSKVLQEGGIAELGQYLGDAGASMDNLSGDNIPKLVTKLQEAGLAGDDLINALKELGITESQLQDLGLADKLGLTEAKEGTEEVKESLQSLADEIIKGKFGNAPERWDKMFEHLVKSGKTAEEAYAAIADAQNEVNKRLGSSVVHTAQEMEKAVSDSVKKANKAASDANAKGGTTGKAAKDFKADPYTSDSKTTKSQAASEADKQMMNNMPYANYMAAKQKQITDEVSKQTVEAYKQKLANEHMYTLKEKEQALASIKANQEIAANTTLTAEKQKQLDAENKKYQKVVDTYNEQQKMVEAINKQEEATKKAEDAEKKRGEAVQNTNKKAVVYGSDEYYKQTSKTGGTINTVAARPKVETKPVEAETKVEVKPQFEIKNVDTTKLKTEVVSKVETEFKDLQAKAIITPKIDTAQAEASIAQFKQKTQDLKTSIPQTFNGIAADVSKSLGTIATKISEEGNKITSTTKTAFQNAANAAANAISSNETINKFKNAGVSAATGYANGIRSKLDAVRSAATSLANTAIKATKTAQKSNSPSKIFTQLGEWNGEGYGNGMLNSIGYVVKASDQMANASIDEMSKIINAVQSSIEEGFDVEPTIVPVMDTSGIQNNLDYINSTFGQQQTMDILADIDTTRAFRNQETENMQSQMDNLRGDLSVLSDALLNQPTPEVNANVVLQGDADGVFKLVQNSNNRYTKMHGKSAFA